MSGPKNLYTLNLERDLQSCEFSLFVLGADEDAAKNETLKKYFGANLAKVLTLDPSPVLVMARGLLDPGGTEGGKPYWYFGKNKYGFKVTLDVWEKEFVPALTSAPMFPGHQTKMEQYEAELSHIVWAGIDNGSPSAVVWAHDEDLKKRMLRAGAINALRKTFFNSLAMRLDVDRQNKVVLHVLTPDQTSLDYVRWPAGEDTGIKEPLVLSQDNPDQGGSKMFELKVNSLAELLSHPDVGAMLGIEVERRLALPDNRAKVLASATLDELKTHHKDVAELAKRPTRAEVLASLSKDDVTEIVRYLGKDEVVAALAEQIKSGESKEIESFLGRTEVASALADRIATLSEKRKEFREKKATPIFVEVLGKEKAETYLLGEDFSHMDENEVRARANLLARNLGIEPGGGNAPVTQKQGSAPKASGLAPVSKDSFQTL